MSEAKQVWTSTNIAAVGLLTLSMLWLAWWFIDRTNYVYVTDARISSTMINVSSRIPGWIVDFPLSEGQQISVGDMLVKIDSRDTELQLKEVEARIMTWALMLRSFPRLTTSRAHNRDSPNLIVQFATQFLAQPLQDAVLCLTNTSRAHLQNLGHFCGW